MIKKCLFLFLSIQIFTIAALNNKVVISKLCELVHEREYILLRLKKIMVVLEKLSKKKAISVSFDEHDTFNNEIIKKTVKNIKRKKTLLPLFECWHALCDYKNINDEQLIKEFTKLTLLIIKKIYINPRGSLPSFVSEIVLDLKGATYTEAITVRSYYAYRLKRAINFLSHVKCRKEVIFEEIKTRKNKECYCIFESHYPFKHPTITDCIYAIELENSLSPLIALSQEFNNFKFIQDDLFTKEFLILVLSIYKNIITHNPLSKEHDKNHTLDLIIHLYENIEALPLENILEAIDLLAEELPKLFERYNEISIQHWKDRLKKYWWLPPTIIGFVKFALIFKPRKRYTPPPLPGTI